MRSSMSSSASTRSISASRAEPGAQDDPVEQPLPHPGVEVETFLRLPQGCVDPHDVVVEPAGLVEPGGGALHGTRSACWGADGVRGRPDGERLEVWLFY